MFVVPARKWQAAIDGCHWSAGHQGRDHTLSLMKERFWWPGMSWALVMAVSNCGRCKQFEAKPQIPGMQPIICTEPMELVHVDYVGMEVTTLPGNLPNLNTKVKDRKGQVQILRDIPPWLLQLPITIQMVLNAVTPRIVTRDARSRNIKIDGHRKTNARKQWDHRNGRVVLPLFWESTKEGALTYTDWRLEVEEYIAKKYPRPKIKEAMFTSLEGKAKWNYQACDERGDLSLEKILKKMDMIYGTSVSFWDLNAKLCRLKQGAQESPKDYYERMVDISVALKEYHGDRFQPRELARMKKQCFFAGLRENYKYLVSHLKDRDDVDPVLMLKEIRDCDESWYLANTSHPPKGTNDGPAKNTNYFDKKNYD